MLAFSVGQRAPAIVGAAESGQFYSLEHQAGRPAVLVVTRTDNAALASALVNDLESLRADFDAAGVDLVPMAPANPVFATSLSGPARAAFVHLAQSGGLEQLTLEHPAAAVILDRGGRIVQLTPVSGAADLKAAFTAVQARLLSEAPRVCAASAPALILPNLLSPAECQDLIAHFEGSDSRPGVMASAKDGQAYAKLDESKKKRREMELVAGTPPHQTILRVLAEQCVPEIKRAFQADIAHADRILLARYDDTGGFFKRHRDDAAPQTAFREFAISLNLNTHEYEGGELLFPEFDDNRYNPPAGAAIIFSASLLHEAAPVTRGSRYVALSFLCTAAALERVVA